MISSFIFTKLNTSAILNNNGDDIMKKDFDFIKQNLIAHRGLHNIKNGIPENSMAAFKKAIEKNYLIELDIHILKDNSVIVFHDDNLERMIGIKKELKHLTYNEIKDYKLLNTNEHIPLLQDVLNLIDGKVPLIIEYKFDVLSGRLEKESMKILNNYNGKFVVKSFNPTSVYWFKKHYPNIPRGQLSSDFKDEKWDFRKKVIIKNMLFNFITKPDFISYDINALPNKKIEKIRLNKPVICRTIKTKEQLKKAKKYCDNYICENFEKIL